MRYTTIVCSLFIPGLVIFIGGCVTSTTPHENFKNRMNYSVGKRADDPLTSITRYSDRVKGRTVLANGNIEIQYDSIRDCMVYFEVDSKSNVIVNWRFEGSEQTCRINP